MKYNQKYDPGYDMFKEGYSMFQELHEEDEGDEEAIY